MAKARVLTADGINHDGAHHKMGAVVDIDHPAAFRNLVRDGRIAPHDLDAKLEQGGRTMQDKIDNDLADAQRVMSAPHVSSESSAPASEEEAAAPADESPAKPKKLTAKNSPKSK
jgi:hypothetical protein